MTTSTFLVFAFKPLAQRHARIFRAPRTTEFDSQESPLLSEVRRSRVGRNVILISPGILFPILFLRTEGTGLCEVGWPGVPCLDRMIQNIWTRTHLEFGRIFLLYEVCCQKWSNFNKSSRLHGAYPAILAHWCIRVVMNVRCVLSIVSPC